MVEGSVVEERSEVPNVTGTRRIWASGHLLFATAALTAIALAIRLFSIGGESLWIDEGYTLLFSRLPLDRVILVGGHHEHPPLYYLLVHALLRLHDSPLAPRLISALAGTLSVPALYALGARLFGPVAGLVGAALLAISPFHMWHGQDGRGYALAGLFVLLSYVSLLTAVDRGRPASWIAYMACTTLALYTEYTTALALLPQAVLAIRATRQGSVRWLLGAWAGVALAYAWWIGTLLANTQRVVADYWMSAPGPGVVATAIMEIIGFEPSCPTIDPCVPNLSVVAFASAHAWIILGSAAVVVASILLAAAWRRSLTVSVLVLWLVVPFVAILLISLRRPLFVDRIFLGATFPIYLLLGAFVTFLHRTRLVALGVVAVIAAASMYNVAVTDATDSNGDWRALMRDLYSAYRPGQAVAYYPGVLRTVGRAYVPESWHPAAERAIWLHTYLDAAGLESRWGRLDDHTLRAIQLAAATKGRSSLWVVTNWYVGQWELHRWLHEHGFRMMVHAWYGASSYLELWQRQAVARFDPVVMADNEFAQRWSLQGDVRISSGSALTQGRTELSRPFSVRPGTPYSVVYQYRSRPFTRPSLAVDVYPRDACRSAGLPRTNTPLATFAPIAEEDFQEFVQGPWHTAPFGFVTPPGASCAVLRLRTSQGAREWRHVGVVDVDR